MPASNLRHVTVTVKPDATGNTVHENGKRLVVETTAQAKNGQANAAAVKLVRRYIKARGQVRIVSGHRKEKKIFAIDH